MSNQHMRGELLEALRLSRGLTQVQVAAATNVSQATLSKLESGDTDVDNEKWAQIADLLGVPSSAFSGVSGSAAPTRIFHRKRKTTPMSAVKKVGAELSLVRLRLGGLLGDRRTTLRRHDLDGGFNTPQEIAALVREDLGLAGDQPIADLVGVLESAGAIVLRWPLEAIQVDAIASWQDDTVPVILVGAHVPPDRQRFTVAHELGHAIMHDEESGDEQEREADAFAGEFLLPADSLRKEWPPTATLESLLPLKKRWGISLAALIRRAADVSVLSDDEYRSWNIRLSTSGMHRREPNPSDRENPTVLAHAIQDALASGTSVEELAERSYMYPDEFTLTFLEETP